MLNAATLLESPLGRVLGRWLDAGPPGLEIRLEALDPPPARRFIIEIRNRGRRAATLTELGLLDGQGERQPFDSPELVLKAGAVLRLRVELPPLAGPLAADRGGRGGQDGRDPDGRLRAYAVDRAHRQFRSA